MNLEKYKILFEALESISVGQVVIKFANGEVRSFKSTKADDLVVDIEIKNVDFIDEVVANGDIGLGETYMRGDWTTSDLAALIEFFIKNKNSLEKFFHANKFKLFLLAIMSFFRRNSKQGSKSNISYHYDLGNDFFSLWLDETMTYSSAIFDNQDVDLKNAQLKKYHRILDKINSGSILEIGCGWGGFAEEVAKQGNEIKCLTLSTQQAKYAEKRMADLSFSDQVEIALQDYRDEKNSYESIVSIEMFEAVGKKYWPIYFKTVAKSLKASGKAMIQAITICDEVYDSYKNRTDFIQKHIFPGGYLPSKSAFIKAAQDQGLEVIDQYCFGQDYAKTLLVWLDNFDQKKSEIVALGYNEEFIRKWRFYLAYCAAGFNSKRTDVVQFLLQKK